jgi:hypothetical protein
VAEPLRRKVADIPGQDVCGDCHLANVAIYEETGKRSVHPIELLAMAYGLHEEG